MCNCVCVREREGRGTVCECVCGGVGGFTRAIRPVATGNQHGSDH